MDFIKGNEQVKIDPSGIDISSDTRNIAIDSEKITGDISLNGKVSVMDAFDVTGDTTLNSKVSIVDDFDVTGKSNFIGDITLAGDLSMNGDFSMNGNIEITGNDNFVITSGGNVGIGTSVPNTQLYINNPVVNNTIQNQITLHTHNTIGGNGTGILFKNRWTNAGWPDGVDFDMGRIAAVEEDNFGGALTFFTKEGDNNHNGSLVERMRIAKGGHVGIGTTAPRVALHIIGTYTTDTQHKSGRVGRWDDWSSSSSWTSEFVGIKVEGSIWVDPGVTNNNSYFLNSSDRRIKTDISLINDSTALDQVNQLETHQYNYVTRKNQMKTIGFIAQEVKEVIPNAVSLQTEYIPDEMRIIIPSWSHDTNNKWLLTIPNLDMSGNFTGKCKFYVSNDPSGNDEVCKEVEIKEVIDDSHVLSTTVNHFAIFDEKWNYIFFYGKEVNDFHTLDKNQIFALHHSAIQELDRKHKQEVIEKNNKISNLEQHVESLTSRLESLESSVLSLQNN